MDEVIFRNTEVGGHASYFNGGDLHLAGPAAAGGATITFVEDGHRCGV